MPQVDLESLVCGESCKVTPDSASTSADHDLPSESYSIPLTDPFVAEWLDITPVYDRDASTKATTNPKSHQHQHQYHHQPPANSQRFSGNLKPAAKAPILGLPNKIQHSGYLGQSNRKPHRRAAPRKGAKVLDPGSPKVSCFGKVSPEKEEGSRHSGGWWGCLFVCFGQREMTAAAAAVKEGERRNAPVPARERKMAAAEEVPGLGGMKRFVSGRRAMSWGGDVGVDLEAEEEDHERTTAWSGPLFRR